MCVPRQQACTQPSVASVASGVTGEQDAEACDPLVDGGQIVLIDDMEDDDKNINHGGIDATWVMSDDKSNGCKWWDVVPIPGGRCGSQYAMRLTIAGLDEWGANVGFSLHSEVAPDGSSHDLPVNATDYTGIHFWAKSGSIPFHFEFKVVDVSGDPSGNQCTADASSTAPDACYVPFLHDELVDNHWRSYDIKFADLTRAKAPPGDAGTPKLDQVFQFQWGIPQDSRPTEWRQLDLWIDDVAWYR